MVSITRSHTVVPSESTPKARLWCSDIDQIVARNHVPSVHVYKPDPEFQFPYIIQRMKDSLSKILVHFYPVAGRIRFKESGRVEVECNEMGVTLLEAETAKALDQYYYWEPNKLTKELVPMVDYSSRLCIEEAPLLLVQVTKASCGGICVGIALSHIISDGSAFAHFINSWAKLARLDKFDQDDMPFLDRTILRFPNLNPAPHFDHPECKQLPLMLGSSDYKEEREKETTVASLRITEEQVEKLKLKANNQIITNQETLIHQVQRSYSRYEVLAAHIWRSVSKARQNDPNQPTVVRIVGDVRSKFNPPLPRNFLGNAILRAVTPTCLVGDIVSNPLSYGAQKIREGTSVLRNDDYLKSQILFLTNDQNADWKCQYAGNPNLHIVSWMSMPTYEADFGWENRSISVQEISVMMEECTSYQALPELVILK
ncbi:hypothetical protein L6164_037176 [Bauhinia variegata]|uniref:Uncharacterized protein n=1 Tax=Bauhinia variegata TaxID=167791 RepID=A0ACB9KK22_BAUVA|nr:hypothetical protein L6164_037176 [Bauhinia variegata]